MRGDCPSFFSNGLDDRDHLAGRWLHLKILGLSQVHLWAWSQLAPWVALCLGSGCSSQGAEYTSDSLESTWNSSSEATCSQ